MALSLTVHSLRRTLTNQKKKGAELFGHSCVDNEYVGMHEVGNRTRRAGERSFANKERERKSRVQPANNYGTIIGCMSPRKTKVFPNVPR